MSKLLWIAAGSHKSRQDVVMMLRRSTGIDANALSQSALDLGVAELYEELRADADRT